MEHFNANHLHVVASEYTWELQLAAQFLGIEIVEPWCPIKVILIN